MRCDYSGASPLGHHYSGYISVQETQNLVPEKCQRAKKVIFDSPGLVDFAIGLVIFVLNLPDGQVLFFGEIQITEGL